ncbi:hypothetical protein BTVI_74048 [Pitangus sulphuratus]|nr:hypothetical protein BTVI_74048 [Pitangus sulphuratus]
MFNFYHFGIHHLDILSCILMGEQGPLLKERKTIDPQLYLTNRSSVCGSLIFSMPFCTEDIQAEENQYPLTEAKGSVSMRELEGLSPFCFTTHFPFAVYVVSIPIKIQSMHRTKSWSFNLGLKLVLDPSQLTLEDIGNHNRIEKQLHKALKSEDNIPHFA